MRSVIDDRLSGSIGVRQHRTVNMDDDLVPLRRRPRLDAVMECCLGDEGERVGLQLQRPQRARHTHPLPRRARIERDAPRQPLRARLEAIGPAATLVELTNEVEQASGGRADMRGELGD